MGPPPPQPPLPTPPDSQSSLPPPPPHYSFPTSVPSIPSGSSHPSSPTPLTNLLPHIPSPPPPVGTSNFIPPPPHPALPLPFLHSTSRSIVIRNLRRRNRKLTNRLKHSTLSQTSLSPPPYPTTSFQASLLYSHYNLQSLPAIVPFPSRPKQVPPATGTHLLPYTPSIPRLPSPPPT